MSPGLRPPGLRSFLPKPTLRLGGALEGLGEGLDTLKGGRGCCLVVDLMVEVLVIVVELLWITDTNQIILLELQ